VNVLVPSHYLVPFSRLGGYDRALLDEVVYRGREFTEQWAHEASIVPVETWPLLRHRMEKHRARPRGFDSFMKKNPAYVEKVLEEVRARGPLAADDLPGPESRSRRIPAWIGTVPRAVLEAHFGRGVLAVAGRRPNYARTFDLAERHLPAEHYERRETHEEAQRALLRLAARAHGVGTAAGGTTSCPSCSGTCWWRAWISRPTGRGAAWSCGPPMPSRARGPVRWPRLWPRSSRRWRRGWASIQSPSSDGAIWPGRWPPRCGRDPGSFRFRLRPHHEPALRAFQHAGGDARAARGTRAALGADRRL